MLDDPRGVDMLESVSKLIRDLLIPKLAPEAVFQARVAANAVDLVVRELRTGERLEQASRDRLRALLGHDGPLPELEAELSTRIREGGIALDDPALMEHLWATTMAKMSIDQPNYASYRREVELRATPTESKPKEQ